MFNQRGKYFSEDPQPTSPWVPLAGLNHISLLGSVEGCRNGEPAISESGVGVGGLLIKKKEGWGMAVGWVNESVFHGYLDWG